MFVDFFEEMSLFLVLLFSQSFHMGCFLNDLRLRFWKVLLPLHLESGLTRIPYNCRQFTIDQGIPVFCRDLADDLDMLERTLLQQASPGLAKLASFLKLAALIIMDPLLLKRTQRLLNLFQKHPSYDGTYAWPLYELLELKAIDASEKSLTFHSKITPHQTNNIGSVHGGCFMTYIDIATTIAIWTFSTSDVATTSVSI